MCVSLSLQVITPMCASLSVWAAVSSVSLCMGPKSRFTNFSNRQLEWNLTSTSVSLPFHCFLYRLGQVRGTVSWVLGRNFCAKRARAYVLGLFLTRGFGEAIGRVVFCYSGSACSSIHFPVLTPSLPPSPSPLRL